VSGASPVGRFRPDQRIRKRLEFRTAQERGRRVTTANFVLLVSYRDDSEKKARLGLVASKKVGCAVVRNRAKRLVREAFRVSPDLFAPGVDLVVIVRRSLDNLKRDDVIAEWRAVERVIRKRTHEAEIDRGHRDRHEPSAS
jgi:ribonuclease P protein component